MEIVAYYLTKPQYNYKHASISLFLSHSPQLLTSSVWIVLFESLGHGCSPRYLKPTFLVLSSSAVGFFLAMGCTRSYLYQGYSNTWYVVKSHFSLFCWLCDVQDQIFAAKISYTLANPSTQTNRRYLPSIALFVSIMSEINIPYALQYLTLCAYIFTA